jgi:hypothetical protein
MDEQRSKMDKLINELRENETLVLNDIDYKESFYIPTSIEKLYIKDCVLSKLFECNLENIRHFEIENVSDIIHLDLSKFSNKIETLIIKNMAFFEMPDFSNLEKLKFLILENNDFTVVSVEKMPPCLEVLSFNNNPLEDLDILEFSSCFKELNIENTKLKEVPVIDNDNDFIINHSYDDNCLKKCEQCLNQIYTLQPYYNKHNDGYFICEPCYEKTIEMYREPGYKRKINKVTNDYYCDNFDCKKKINSHMFFDPTDIVYVDIDEDSDCMFCEECYETYEMDFPGLMKMNIDVLEECIYRFKNRNIVMNITSDDELAQTNDIIDDIYSHNYEQYYKAVVRSSPPNIPYSHNDIQSILQMKYKFPKLDLNKLDSSLMESLFLSNNLYMIEYFLRNMRFSMKTLRDYFWKILYNGHTDTIIFLLSTFPLFFNDEYLVTGIEDLNERIVKMIKNNKLENLKYLEYRFDITSDDIMLDQELFDYLCINEHTDMLYFINYHETVNFQESLNKLLKYGNYKSETFYEICEMLYDLSEVDLLEFNFELKSSCKLFVENILINGEDINFIKHIFSQTKDVVKIDVPYKVFIEACKNEDIDYCDMFVEMFPNDIFIELEDSGDSIIDYGKIGQGLFKKPLNRFKNIIPIECCICMDNLSTIITHCRHQYCKSCIKKTFDTKTECPLCRQNIDNKVYYLAAT